MIKKSLIAAALLTTVLLATITTFAEGVNPNERKGVITNVDNELSKINKYYYTDNIAYTIVNGYKASALRRESTDIKDFNIKVSNLKNIKMKDATPEYIGQNTFANNTNTEQTYSTVSYAHSSSKTASTTVTKGFSILGKIAKTSIPLLLPNGIEISPTINTSTTNTETVSESVTLTVPPQSVKVPAHKKYKVEVVYLRESVSGDLDFHGKGTDLTANITARMVWWGAGGRPSKEQTFKYNTTTMFKNLSSSQKNTIEGITFNDTNGFDISGTATLNGIVGTTFEVNTYDITDSSQPLLVQQEIVKMN